MIDDINRERLELALEAAGLDLWENDLITGDVTCKATKTFAELGYSVHEAASYVDDLFKIVHPDDVQIIKTAVQEHITGISPQYRCEFRLLSKSGAWAWYANYGKIMDHSLENRGKRFIGVTFNIDDRKRKEDELALINRKLYEQNTALENMNSMLQEMAASDPLTGIPNRRKLVEVGASEFQLAHRFGHPLSLLMLDIDRFKQVNDDWGHSVGDYVIRSVADECVNSVRNNMDTVARIGGEEFAIILPQTDYVSAYEMAERLRQSIEKLRIPVNETNSLSCTISIGVTTISGFCTTFEHLMINADKALYRAKDAGRNCVQGDRS